MKNKEKTAEESKKDEPIVENPKILTKNENDLTNKPMDYKPENLKNEKPIENKEPKQEEKQQPKEKESEKAIEKKPSSTKMTETKEIAIQTMEQDAFVDKNAKNNESIQKVIENNMKNTIDKKNAPEKPVEAIKQNKSTKSVKDQETTTVSNNATTKQKEENEKEEKTVKNETTQKNDIKEKSPETNNTKNNNENEKSQAPEQNPLNVQQKTVNLIFYFLFNFNFFS